VCHPSFLSRGLSPGQRSLQDIAFRSRENHIRGPIFILPDTVADAASGLKGVTLPPGFLWPINISQVSALIDIVYFQLALEACPDQTKRSPSHKIACI
jgi:hypothetical protein